MMPCKLEQTKPPLLSCWKTHTHIAAVLRRMQRTIHLMCASPGNALAYDEVQISRVPDPKIILRWMVTYNLEQTWNLKENTTCECNKQ